MSKQSKRLAKQHEQVQKELIIPIEDFFNYYSIPWDKNFYIKFPVNSIIIHQKETKMAFKSSFEDDCFEDSFTKIRDKFMEDNYLGSARATDEYRLKYIVGNRTELKI